MTFYDTTVGSGASFWTQRQIDRQIWKVKYLQARSNKQAGCNKQAGKNPALQSTIFEIIEQALISKQGGNLSLN